MFTQHFVIMTEFYVIILIVAKVRLLLTMNLADIFPGVKIMGVVFRFSKRQKFFDNGLHPHIISVTEILSILMYWHFITTERESFIFFFIEKKFLRLVKKIWFLKYYHAKLQKSN